MSTPGEHVGGLASTDNSNLVLEDGDDLDQKRILDLTKDDSREESTPITGTSLRPLGSEDDKMLKGIVRHEVNDLLERGALRAEHRSVATLTNSNNDNRNQENEKHRYPSTVYSTPGDATILPPKDGDVHMVWQSPEQTINSKSEGQEYSSHHRTQSVVNNYVLWERAGQAKDSARSKETSYDTVLSPPPTNLARTRRELTVSQPGAVAIYNNSEGLYCDTGMPDQEGEMKEGSSSSFIDSEDEDLSHPQHLWAATLVEDGTKTDQEYDREPVEAEPALEGLAALAGNRYLKPMVFLVLLLVVLAITIPLAILLPGSGRKDLILDGVDPKLLRCGTRSIQQSDYRGLTTMSQVGIECQDWSSQYPHQHQYTPDAYPDANLLSNYCRNPSGSDKPKAWCYTKDPNHRWAFCDVSFCNEDPYELREDCSTALLGGYDYRGNISVSATGKRCLPWNRSGQHTTNENFPSAGLEANYCRNPDSDQPYCMVDDPKHPRELCDLPSCRSVLKGSKHKEPCTNCTNAECGTPRLKYADYRGTVNVTVNGEPCLIWRDHLPLYEYTFEDDLLDTNYCRQIERSDFPVCYYLHPILGHAELAKCDVPSCEDNFVPRRFCGSESRAQDDYRGDLKVTASGKACLPWTNEVAMLESWNPNARPFDGLVDSYCRNPDVSTNAAGSLPKKAGPWCYIEAQDDGKDWEYCDVPSCKDCGTGSRAKQDYTGTASQTRSGKVCLPWEDREYLLVKENSTLDVVVEHQGESVSYQFGIREKYSLEENYCRNPLPYQRETVFCFVDQDGGWEYCDVPECEEPALVTQKDCGSYTERQADYRGDSNVTASGKACRPWELQEEFTAELYPEAGLEGAYCRQPARSARLAAWCFVNETEMTWEYCDVPIC